MSKASKNGAEKALLARKRTVLQSKVSNLSTVSTWYKKSKNTIAPKLHQDFRLGRRLATSVRVIESIKRVIYRNPMPCVPEFLSYAIGFDHRTIFPIVIIIGLIFIQCEYTILAGKNS